MPNSQVAVTRQQVVAFRLAGHHLDARLPAGSLLAAAGACAVQNTPPGAALLSLGARVEGLRSEELTAALERDKTLLQTWSLRAAPHLFPVTEAPVFTLGLLPGTSEWLQAFVAGIGGGLDVAGMSIDEVVQQTTEAVRHVLDGRAIAGKQQLDRELAEWVAVRLQPAARERWGAPFLYAAGQKAGEALVSFSLRPAALAGWVCFGARQGGETTFARTDQWLGAAIPELATSDAQAELVRRYLRCYGPSTPGDFAAWAGIVPEHAAAIWQGVEDALVEVRVEGRRAWLLREELERFMPPATPAAPPGARFLPAHDPYLQQRDRVLIVPEKARQRVIWRTAGAPGAVLRDGEVAGTWRGRKSGDRLHVDVTWFGGTPEDRDAVETEAVGVAALRGCSRGAGLRRRVRPPGCQHRPADSHRQARYRRGIDEDRRTGHGDCRPHHRREARRAWA